MVEGGLLDKFKTRQHEENELWEIVWLVIVNAMNIIDLINYEW